MELVSFVRPREYSPRQSENVFKLGGITNYMKWKIHFKVMLVSACFLHYMEGDIIEHNHEIWIKIFLMYLNKRITKICKFERTLDSKMGEGFNL